MQVKVSTRHGHLSEESQARLREKAEKLLTYFGRLTMIEVTVDLQKDTRRVEIQVDAEHKHDFVAHEDHADLFVAFDAAMRKVEAQIHRYKEKAQDHRRDPSTGEGVSPVT